MNDETRLVPAQDERALMDADELAAKVVAALDMLAAIIPDLRKPHPATAKKVRKAVSSIIDMVETSPALQGMNTMNIDRAREVLGSADAYRLLGERLEMLCAQVKYTAEARWAEVAAQALTTYRMADIVADLKEPDLAAHVAIVRRHLGRRNAATGKRKKPKVE